MSLHGGQRLSPAQKLGVNEINLLDVCSALRVFRCSKRNWLYGSMGQLSHITVEFLLEKIAHSSTRNAWASDNHGLRRTRSKQRTFYVYSRHLRLTAPTMRHLTQLLLGKLIPEIFSVRSRICHQTTLYQKGGHRIALVAYYNTSAHQQATGTTGTFQWTSRRFSWITLDGVNAGTNPRHCQTAKLQS